MKPLFGQTRSKKRICLFDVDGTLTSQRRPIGDDIIMMLRDLSNVMDIGIVSGGTYVNLQRILGESLSLFVYIFPENGCQVYHHGNLIESNDIQVSVPGDAIASLWRALGLAVIDNRVEIMALRDELIASNTFPIEKANTEIPTTLEDLSRFLEDNCVEKRAGVWNFNFFGKPESTKERACLERHLREHPLRQALIRSAKAALPCGSGEWRFVCGGAISIDIFPVGWDKSAALRHLTDFEDVYFFGDMTHPGGNDHEIFDHPRTKGWTVADPEHTIKLVYDVIGEIQPDNSLQYDSASPTSTT